MYINYTTIFALDYVRLYLQVATSIYFFCKADIRPPLQKYIWATRTRYFDGPTTQDVDGKSYLTPREQCFAHTYSYKEQPTVRRLLHQPNTVAMRQYLFLMTFLVGFPLFQHQFSFLSLFLFIFLIFFVFSSIFFGVFSFFNT